MDEQEEEFIRRINNKEEKGYRELFKRYYRYLVVVARRYIQDPDDAEDMVQDALLNLWQSTKQFNSTYGLQQYLYTAVKNVKKPSGARPGMVVYDPYVIFRHYESKSRGLEDTPEKVERFNGEIAVFADRWGKILEEGDPYYNPNLTLRKSNFALRDLNHEKPGEPYKLELDVKKQLQIVEREKNRREALKNRQE